MRRSTPYMLIATLSLQKRSLISVSVYARKPGVTE